MYIFKKIPLYHIKQKYFEKNTRFYHQTFKLCIKHFSYYTYTKNVSA